MKSQHLTSFWAVTRRATATSIYKVEVSDCCAVATKMDTKEMQCPSQKKGLERKDGVKVNSSIGCPARPILFVRETCIEAFQSHKERLEEGLLSDEDLHLGAFGGNTSTVVGLFLREDSAKECFNTTFRPGVIAYDPEWKDMTEEAIRAIGPNHPFIRFSINSEKWPAHMDEVMFEITSKPL